jgi:hypothetical protein
MIIKILVRPREGYHYPDRIDEIEIDSSARLETIQEKYSTQGSTTRLYHGPYELPLNSSIGSHNFEDGAIIECCRSPGLSAALSACLKDFDKVKKLRPVERCRANLMRILQTPLYVQNDPDHEIWKVESWSDEKVKSRTINFAIIKSVLQRQNRYHVHDLPQCSDCQSLFDELKAHNVWNGGASNGGRKKSSFNAQAHIFKPLKNDGNPSTNWILLNAKMEIQRQIMREFQYDFTTTHDYLEEFVIRDHGRHETGSNSTPNRRKKSKNQVQDDSDAYLAYLPTTPPRSAVGSAQRPPAHTTSYTNTSRSPARSNTMASTPRGKQYIPQYASAPFAVLATLHLAMHAKHKLLKSRKLTLTEDELKRLAQPSCRSNMYDKTRIRGRNAFACMDNLIEKQLVRKEIVRDPRTGHSEIDKWGLLPDGEVMGQFCAEFERAVRTVIPREKIGAKSSGKSIGVVLCMDTREDVHYLERLRWKCQDENVPFAEKELPAGDYLFLEESLDEIIPIVVERKSWSDLADSCLGKGLARNRLECVQLNRGYSSSCEGNCQLCKMKRCGCTQILFVIEGERCQGAQRNERCTVETPCASCKLLVERHNVTQTELESVLTRLQLEHGCYIHYTKSFNDTIASLFCIRALLQRTASHSSHLLDQRGGDRTLSFEQYTSNTRRGQDNTYKGSHREPQTLEEWDIQALVSTIQDEWNDDTVSLLLGSEPSEQPKKKSKGETLRRNEPITLDDDESDIEIVESCRKQPETIRLDSDSDGDSDVVEVSAVRNLKMSDDSIIVLDGPNPVTTAKLSSKKASRPRHCNEKKTPAKRKAHQIDGSNSNRKAQGNHAMSMTSILMLHNLRNYEAKLGKGLDKLWRDAYNIYSNGERDTFFQQSLEMVTNSASFVNGRTVSSFGLWLQIVVGIHIRFVEECNVANDLRSKLRSHGANASSTSFVARHHEPSSQVYSTPRKSNAAICNIDSTMNSTGHELKKSRPQTSLSNNDAIREARLRRFERPRQAATAAGYASGSDRQCGSSCSTWFCQQCTLENELSAVNCAACGFNIDSVASSNSDLQESSRFAPLKCPSSTYDPLSSSLARSSSVLPTWQTFANSEWSCPRCTLRNDAFAARCSTCEYTYSGAVSEPSKPLHSNRKKRQRHTHGNEPWLCEGCMFENSMKDEKCFDCGRPNTNHPNYGSESISNTYHPPSSFMASSSSALPNYGSETSARKKIKCGACGKEGHNRASATALNCPAYYNDSEVELREKKEQKKLAEIVQARQAIESIENERETASRVNEELLEKMEEMKRNNARAEQYRKEELKRQQAKLKRLQKRK